MESLDHGWRFSHDERPQRRCNPGTFPSKLQGPSTKQMMQMGTKGLNSFFFFFFGGGGGGGFEMFRALKVLIYVLAFNIHPFGISGI